MSRMRQWKQYTVIFLLIVVFHVSLSAQADEGGGITGAEFLLTTPVARMDAMSGILDGLNSPLEGITFNPAVTAGLEQFQLAFTINPLPNEVTHSLLTAGFPAMGGYGAVSAQLFNVGQYTDINAAGQPTGTYNIFDAAAAVSYSRYLWQTLSFGINLKGIYRNLGSYFAFTGATDIGIAARFETPHIGQRPKAPTDEQLEKEFMAAVAKIEKQKAVKTENAGKELQALEKEAAKREAALEVLEEKIAKTSDPARRESLIAGKQEMETALETARADLETAREKQAEALEAIGKWYEEEYAAARAAYDTRVEKYANVEKEREKLYGVINDPAKLLADDMIDAHIDQSIAKTGEYLEERRLAFNTQNSEYAAKSRARAEEVKKEMASYQEKVTEELGPQEQILQDEIKALNEELAGLADSTEADARSRVKDLKLQLKEKEKEAAVLYSDPWIKRLKERIAGKEQELEKIDREIAAKQKFTDDAVKVLEQQSRADIDTFERLRISLVKELKKASLKKELNLMDAASPAAEEKIRKDYKAAEKEIYLKLLTAMYSHEEKIFQARLDSLRNDAQNSIYDHDIQKRKTDEMLDDNFAFQNLTYSKKMAALKNDIKAKPDEKELLQADLTRLEEELREQKTTYTNAVKEREEQAAEFRERTRTELAAKEQEVRDQKQITRLIFLQTDKPYLNTAFNAGVRNLGLPVRFVEESYPLPLSFNAVLAYTLVHLDNHVFSLSFMFDYPVFDAMSFAFGCEYGFGDFFYIRAGYTLGAPEKSFTAGFGVKLTFGFSQAVIDYAFKPISDYGFSHVIGIAAKL